MMIDAKGCSLVLALILLAGVVIYFAGVGAFTILHG